jgi:hypothetical protein
MVIILRPIFAAGAFLGAAGNKRVADALSDGGPNAFSQMPVIGSRKSRPTASHAQLSNRGRKPFESILCSQPAD